jgi:hypothetical protein
MAKINSNSMINFRIQEQSVMASLEGTRKINNVISKMVKKEIVDFISKSGKQIILELNGVSGSNGIVALKAIAELAKTSEKVFSSTNLTDEIFESIELKAFKELKIIVKN